MKLRKSVLCLLAVMLMSVLCLGACKKDETVQIPSDVGDEGSYEQEDITEDLPVESQPAGDEVEDNTDSEVTEEEPKILVAKTYKQIHPELYNFYPAEPNLTYTKWIYTIDKQSDFVGSIIYPDGTVITGTGDVDGEITIEKDKYTQTDEEKRPGGAGSNVGNDGTSPDNGNNGGSTGTGDDNDNGELSGPSKVKGDPTVNPSGKDYTLDGGDGFNITVTTKTVEDVKVDTSNTNPYVLEFKVKDVDYILKSYTIEAAMTALLQEGIYPDLEGSVFINTPSTVNTAKGTFTEYIISGGGSGTNVYAVTYTPRYTANTVYVLYSDSLENNKDLMPMLQKMIIE